MKRLSNHGGASVYGDDQLEVPQLCKNTQNWVRNHRAVGTLKNEEEGVVPYPELEDDIVEESGQDEEVPSY